jgi:tripartite ATP-independent transporter DctM subunit
MSTFLVVLFVLVLVLGLPVAFGMGVLALSYLLVAGNVPLMTMPQKMVTGMDSFLLLAIPFFLLAGGLMNAGGITARLVDFSTTLVGHIHGGLGHVTVVANVIMSGMSGSAAADAAATGSVLIPSMVRQGYTPGFAAAISAAAACIGPIIPPSIAFVIFGSMTGVSVGQLFVAGVVPGLLMGVYLMGTCYLVARRRGYGAAIRRATAAEVWQSFLRAGPAMLTPVVVLGGIVAGVVTPTEAAAVAVLYSLLLGLAYRELRWRALPGILTEVVVTTSVVYLLLGVFNLLGWILAVEQIPQALAGGFLALTDQPWLVLLVINVLLFVLGIPIEPVPLMVILGPMLVPVVAKYGIDPVHFGVVFVFNVVLGVITPPVGTNMFITCSIANCSVGAFTRESWPFIVALVLLLLLITYVPSITLFLPRLLMR